MQMNASIGPQLTCILSDDEIRLLHTLAKENVPLGDMSIIKYRNLIQYKFICSEGESYQTNDGITHQLYTLDWRGKSFTNMR